MPLPPWPLPWYDDPGTRPRSWPLVREATEPHRQHTTTPVAIPNTARLESPEAAGEEAFRLWVKHPSLVPAFGDLKSNRTTTPYDMPGLPGGGPRVQDAIALPPHAAWRCWYRALQSVPTVPDRHVLRVLPRASCSVKDMAS